MFNQQVCLNNNIFPKKIILRFYFKNVSAFHARPGNILEKSE